MSTDLNQPKMVYTRPKSLHENNTSFCPGCGHGIINKLIAQVIDELEIQDTSIIVAPVGCAVLMYHHINVDGCEAAHGRAPAVATGIKRVHPDKNVIVYQGDGDLLAIGMAETIHAANRGEHISVIFVNNAIYGMTGGQMAPTTLENQKTTTSPAGRDIADTGAPIKACELLDTLQAPVYIERTSVHNPKAVVKTKKAIKKAIKNQMEGKGYSFVEILSTCPINWGMTPSDAMKWVEDNMLSYYELKTFRG